MLEDTRFPATDLIRACLGVCENDVSIPGDGGFPRVVSIRHDGHTRYHWRLFAKGQFVVLMDMAFLGHPLSNLFISPLNHKHHHPIRVGIGNHGTGRAIAPPDIGDCPVWNILPKDDLGSLVLQSLEVPGSVWIKREGDVYSGGIVVAILVCHIALLQDVIHFPLPLNDRIFGRVNGYSPRQTGSRLITDSFYHTRFAFIYQGVNGMPLDLAEGQWLPASR